MPCPTCGCTCCQTTGWHPTFTVVDPTVYWMGRDRLFAFSTPQHIDSWDLAVPVPRRTIAEAAAELLARKAMAPDDHRPFHQRINRKPWERHA